MVPAFDFCSTYTMLYFAPLDLYYNNLALSDSKAGYSNPEVAGSEVETWPLCHDDVTMTLLLFFKQRTFGQNFFSMRRKKEKVVKLKKTGLVRNEVKETKTETWSVKKCLTRFFSSSSGFGVLAVGTRSVNHPTSWLAEVSRYEDGTTRWTLVRKTFFFTPRL